MDDENHVFHSNTAEILAGLREAGYQSTDTTKWHNNQFCPKWRYLVHLLLQCISNKCGGWDQFSLQLGCGIVCLSKGLTYNFSKFIFENMLENIDKQQHKFLMYPRFLQIILDITTKDRTHVPIKRLGSKLFASMKTNYNGEHRPLLAAMLPHGNDNVVEGDDTGNVPTQNAADDGNPSSSGIAADGNPLVVIEEGPATTAEPLPNSTDLPPPSPAHMSPSATISPSQVAPVEQTLEFEDTFQSLEPEFTRLPTPSPMRDPFDEGFPNVVHESVSPAGFNEAPLTTEQSAGRVEDPITLTSVYDSLCRYMKRTDDLQKELADTMSNLGNEIETLKSKVQDLEAQLNQQKQSKGGLDTTEVPQEANLDSLEILAEVAGQSHVAPPKDAEVLPSKPPIQFSRRRSRRQYLAKKAAESSKVSSGDDVLMAEATDLLQEKQSPSVVDADKSTDKGHTSGDTFFVAGKEYLNSPVHNSSGNKQVSPNDITETLKPQRSTDNILNSDVQELNDDPMEDLDVPHDDFTEGTEVVEDEIITAE